MTNITLTHRIQNVEFEFAFPIPRDLKLKLNVYTPGNFYLTLRNQINHLSDKRSYFACDSWNSVQYGHDNLEIHVSMFKMIRKILNIKSIIINRLIIEYPLYNLKANHELIHRFYSEKRLTTPDEFKDKDPSSELLVKDYLMRKCLFISNNQEIDYFSYYINFSEFIDFIQLLHELTKPNPPDKRHYRRIEYDIFFIESITNPFLMRLRYEDEVGLFLNLFDTNEVLDSYHQNNYFYSLKPQTNYNLPTYLILKFMLLFIGQEAHIDEVYKMLKEAVKNY